MDKFKENIIKDRIKVAASYYLSLEQTTEEIDIFFLQRTWDGILHEGIFPVSRVTDKVVISLLYEILYNNALDEDWALSSLDFLNRNDLIKEHHCEMMVNTFRDRFIKEQKNGCTANEEYVRAYYKLYSYNTEKFIDPLFTWRKEKGSWSDYLVGYIQYVPSFFEDLFMLSPHAYGSYFKYIENPSSEAIIEAYAADENNILFLKEEQLTKEVVDQLVTIFLKRARGTTYYINTCITPTVISKLSTKQRLDMLEEDARVIRHFNNPSKEELLAAVSKKPRVIACIPVKNISPDLFLLSISKDPKVLRFYDTKDILSILKRAEEDSTLTSELLNDNKDYRELIKTVKQIVQDQDQYNTLVKLFGDVDKLSEEKKR